MLPHHRHDGFSVRNFTNINSYYKLGYDIDYIFITENIDHDFSEEKIIFPEINFIKINPETSILKNTLTGKFVYWFGFPSNTLLNLIFDYRIPLNEFVKKKSVQHPDSIFHFEAIDTAVCLYGTDSINGIWSNHDYVSERFKKRQKVLNGSHITFRKMIKNYIHYLKLKKIENLVVKSTSMIITISETEKEKYKRRWPNNNIQLLPISWHDEKIVEKHKSLKGKKILKLLHIGRIDGFLGYQSLKYIIEKIFPMLNHEILIKVDLTVIGLENESEKTTEIKKIASKFSNIRFKGFVDDIRKYYDESDLQLVAPTVATGSRTKIIESLVYGLPVLSTSEAADGLIGLKNKENIFLAETPKKFLNYLKHIIENPSILKSIRKNGKDTYDALYSQNSGKNKLKELIQNTFGEK
tara:strand:+ start:7323 stop:8552 length:1230 start_codon:yes stop_codon:yes gene_type:complete